MLAAHTNGCDYPRVGLYVLKLGPATFASRTGCTPAAKLSLPFMQDTMRNHCCQAPGEQKQQGQCKAFQLLRFWPAHARCHAEAPVLYFAPRKVKKIFSIAGLEDCAPIRGQPRTSHRSNRTWGFLIAAVSRRARNGNANPDPDVIKIGMKSINNEQEKMSSMIPNKADDNLSPEAAVAET